VPVPLSTTKTQVAGAVSVSVSDGAALPAALVALRHRRVRRIRRMQNFLALYARLAPLLLTLVLIPAVVSFLLGKPSTGAPLLAVTLGAALSLRVLYLDKADELEALEGGYDVDLASGGVVGAGSHETERGFYQLRETLGIEQTRAGPGGGRQQVKQQKQHKHEPQELQQPMQTLLPSSSRRADLDNESTSVAIDVLEEGSAPRSPVQVAPDLIDF
jgi:hypothetical protein